jgi:HD-like signal output (HDOD) protein
MSLFSSLKQKFSVPAKKTSEKRITAVKREAYQDEKALGYLKRLVPIGKLDDAQLRNLLITSSSYATGAIVFSRGEITDALPYLLTGEVYLETSGHKNISVKENTFEALHPLSSGDYCNATAICKTDSRILFIPKIAMDQYRQLQNINPKQLLDLPEQLQNNSILKRFISANNLTMPALPDIAIKVRQAMQKDLGVREVAKIVNMDPAISAKLIQIANSPVYMGTSPTTTCLNAINRIGLNSTKNLITSISLSSLFKIKRPELNALAQQAWKQSIRISAFSSTLAKLTRTCDPEEALLAGLISNIGIAPFLKFADSLPEDQYDLAEVKAAFPFICSSISALILEKWNFPDNMKNIPLETRHWFLAGKGTKADLVDIVLLAKYHSHLGTEKATKLPPITSFPSYAHIKEGELSPDKSLKILNDAKQQISETMQFFSS